MWRRSASQCLERAIKKCFKNAATHNRIKAAIEWTCSSRESLLLLAHCTGGLGVLYVACSNLPSGASIKAVLQCGVWFYSGVDPVEVSCGNLISIGVIGHAWQCNQACVTFAWVVHTGQAWDERFRHRLDLQCRYLCVAVRVFCEVLIAIYGYACFERHQPFHLLRRTSGNERQPEASE